MNIKARDRVGGGGMKVPFSDLYRQYQNLQTGVDQAIQQVIAQAAFIGTSGNPFVKTFERAFAEFLGLDHCVGCGNGTDSLEIILKAWEIGPGDEVIVPANTWISTSEAVSNIGARPVFVDCLPDLYTIDSKRVSQAITARTKAIIPVHLYGLCAEMDEIMAIAEGHGLKVLEDCAQAHGATYKGHKAGTIGHAGSFSFFPGKNLGAFGDAGCMVTNDGSLAERLRRIGNHGQLAKHDHQREGRNSRLDGIQAAVLTVKLKHLDSWVAARQSIASRYRARLPAFDVVVPVIPGYSTHGFHLFVIRTQKREALREKLKKAGVETGVHYPQPLPFLPAYGHWHLDAGQFPVCAEYQAQLLSLPIFPEMTDDMVQYVVDSFS